MYSDQFKVRCTPEERQRWTEAAGSDSLAAWTRWALNQMAVSGSMPRVSDDERRVLKRFAGDVVPDYMTL